MRLLCVSFLLCLSSFYINAQKGMITKEGSKYIFEGKKYGFRELAPIFESAPDAEIFFNRFKKNNRAANILGFSALGMAGLGAILISSAPSSESLSGEVIIGLLAILASSVPGTFGIITRISASVNRRLTIDSFNNYIDGLDLGIENNYESPVLEFGIVGHGIGMGIRF